ncbi:hypothetical protein [uncultured Dokdonia sp.]|uniref:hypothetical protein n=1 Tax=uncultured Dokdonia sp. TaxID=575653 RepID=UPI002638B23A|nr:hypothetical protein [uncultured Dokdonia sp.]
MRQIAIISLCILYSLISYSQNDTYIIGNYEYVSLKPASEESKIKITTIVNEVEETTPPQQKRMDSLQSLRDNDPRFSKVYLHFTKNHTTEYRFGLGLKIKSNNKKKVLYKGIYPTYEVIEKKGDSIFVLDKQFNSKAILIKTHIDLSDYPVQEVD